MLALDGRVGNFITLDNISYSYFAGNDYLGLVNSSVGVKDAVRALEKYGINFAASRQTTGTSDIHIELEELLAEFKGQQEAVVFATGYMGNSMLMNALKNQYSAIIADSLSHPSVLDGVPREISNIHFYDHCKTAHLEYLLQKWKKYRPLIITDGIFALTGEITPLDEIYCLAQKYNALLIVDDAHATGVLGGNGRGTPEHFNLSGAENIYQSETMSKAFGAYGGFISAGEEIIQLIRSRSTFYGASTALPPPIVAAAIASVQYMKEHPELREQLRTNAELTRKGIRELDFETTGEATPIIPIFFQDQQKAKKLSDFLKRNRIIAPAVNYPVKLEKFVVRITVSAKHTKDQIEKLLQILKKWRDNYGTNPN